MLSKPFDQRVDVPSYVDPRGFATFAMTGLALLIFGWLARRGGDLPRRVGQLAVLAALLLFVVYFGRLIVLNPKKPMIKWVAVVSGLLVNPAFYVAFGRSLLGRGAPAEPGGEAAAAPAPDHGLVHTP